MTSVQQKFELVSGLSNVSVTNGSDSAESGNLAVVKNSLTALMLATGMGETEALFRYALGACKFRYFHFIAASYL